LDSVVTTEKGSIEMKKHIMFIAMPTPVGFANTLADVSFEQIGLGYIASILKQHGYEVFLFDAHSRELEESKIIEKIWECKPHILCLSPTYLSWDGTIKILKGAKKINPRIQTILGGPHVSFEPVLSQALRRFDCIDYIIRGEGERIIIPVVENIDKKMIGNTLGVCYRKKDGTPHISDELAEQVENLDELPFPLKDIEPLSGKSVRITTSRGCYINGRGCSFCQMPAQNPHGWRCRSPENVVDEIEFWAKKGHRSFVCAEGDFLGLSKHGIRRAGKIGEEILRRNLDIRLRVFGGVPGIIAAEKNGVLSTLKKAGLERMYPGIEAGNEEDLKLYEKNIAVSQIKMAVNILRRRSICLQIGFIMFNPWSDSIRLKANVSLLKQIDQAHLWFNFAYRLGLFPGSRLLSKVFEKELVLKPIESVGLGSELVHNYRFKVPYVSRIADACAEILKAEAVIQVDRLLITAGVLTSDYTLYENSYPLDSCKSNIKREYEKYKDVIANLNTITFFRILELCERGDSDEKLKNFISSHLIKINEILPDIKKLCSGLINIQTK
jgi:radical SAM superfamily enzyme YgiQ (UPF0313 family)